MYEEFMHVAKVKREEREITNRTVVCLEQGDAMHYYTTVIGTHCFVTEYPWSGAICFEGLVLDEISIESLRPLRNGEPKGGVSNGKKEHCTDHDN